MLLAHGGEAVGLVLHRVLLGADAEEAAVEQPHRAGQHAVAGQLVGAVEVPVDHARAASAARARSRASRRTSRSRAGAPLRVVEVLLAAGGVDPRGLQVAARVRADPHVLPGRRDAELGDPLDVLGLGDALAVGRPGSVKPFPALRRVRPGDEQSARREPGRHGVSLPGGAESYFFAPALAREDDFLPSLLDGLAVGLPVRLRLAGLRVLDRREARLERGHQVGHLLRLLVRRLDRDLLAVGLAPRSARAPSRGTRRGTSRARSPRTASRSAAGPS